MRGLVDTLPQSKIRDKLNGALDRGGGTVDNYTKKAQQYAETARDKTTPWIDSTSKIVEKLGGLATDFANH